MARHTMDIFEEAMGEIERGSIDAQFTLEAVRAILRNSAGDVTGRGAAGLAEELVTFHFDEQNAL